MRPSHLVIDGGEPPLLKITVWLGNKAADKYRLAPLFGRADVGKIPHGHRWDLPRSEFAPDSPLEGDGFELPVPARDRSRRAAVQKTLGVARQPFEQVQLVIEFRARRRIAVRQIQASDDQAADGRLDVAAMRII
jgi:hypothetical protein